MSLEGGQGWWGEHLHKTVAHSAEKRRGTARREEKKRTEERRGQREEPREEMREETKCESLGGDVGEAGGRTCAKGMAHLGKSGSKERREEKRGEELRG